MHFDIVMAEEQPVSTFWQEQEDKRYNLALLAHHRLTKGQIYGEFTSEEAVWAMAAENPNFLEEQRALYEVMCNARAATVDAQMALKVADGNVGSCTPLLAPLRPRCRSIHVQAADSNEEE